MFPSFLRLNPFVSRLSDSCFSLCLCSKNISSFSTVTLASLAHWKLWLCFAPPSLFLTLPERKRETFNSYWFGDGQFLLEIPFNHKSWFIVGPLTILFNCCLANQVYSFSTRNNPGSNRIGEEIVYSEMPHLNLNEKGKKGLKEIINLVLIWIYL